MRIGVLRQISGRGLQIVGRAARRLVFATLLGLLSGAAAAGELGHHWEDPAYLGEMRLQVAAMMIGVFAAAAWSWLVVFLRRRSGAR